MSGVSATVITNDNVINLDITDELTSTISNCMDYMSGAYLSNDILNNKIDSNLTVLLYNSSTVCNDGTNIPSCIDIKTGEFNDKLVCYFNMSDTTDSVNIKGEKVGKDVTMKLFISEFVIRTGYKWKIKAGKVADKEFNCIAICKNMFNDKTGSKFNGAGKYRRIAGVNVDSTYLDSSKFASSMSNTTGVSQVIVPNGIYGKTDTSNEIIVANTNKGYGNSYGIVVYNVVTGISRLATVQELAIDSKYFADCRFGIIEQNNYLYYISYNGELRYLTRVDKTSGTMNNIDITSIYNAKANLFFYNGNLYYSKYIINSGFSGYTLESQLDNTNIIRQYEQGKFIVFIKKDANYNGMYYLCTNPFDFISTTINIVNGFYFKYKTIIYSVIACDNNSFGVGISDNINGSNLLAYKKLDSAEVIKSTREYTMTFRIGASII